MSTATEDLSPATSPTCSSLLPAFMHADIRMVVTFAPTNVTTEVKSVEMHHEQVSPAFRHILPLTPSAPSLSFLR